MCIYIYIYCYIILLFAIIYICKHSLINKTVSAAQYSKFKCIWKKMALFFFLVFVTASEQ